MPRPDLPTPAEVATLAARLQSQFIREAPPRELFEELLPTLLAATGSGAGLLAEVVRDERGAEVLPLVPAERTWDDAGEAAMRTVLRTGEPVITGQGPDAFACVPLCHGRTLVGVAWLARRADGYDAALIAHFEVLWIAIGSMLGSVQLARQRRAAGEALQHQDALWHRLTALLPAAIFQFRRDPLGRDSMPLATPGLLRLYGLAPDAVRHDARALLARVHPDDRPRLLAAIDASARDGQPFRLEFRVLSPDDGAPRWHDGHAMPERESDGGTLWHGYVVDITERKRYDDALVSAEAAQRANQAKTEFLSRMSHELRTPLNAVIGFAQLLQFEAATLSEAQRNRVTHIEQAGVHLLAMINDVLDLSRIEAGKLPLTAEPLDVAALIDESLALVGAQALSAQVALQRAPAPPGQRVHADRVRLRQVLLNLLSNAIKYNRPGGQVHVAVRPAGTQLLIEIADTGIGMTAQQLAHLWEPFNRLGAERTPVEGTGLGLALTQRLVNMMDGRLVVDSSAGRGSVFTVCLPRGDTPTVAVAAAPTAANAPRRRCVLYAGGDARDVERVRQVVQLRPQLQLHVATNDDEALALARRHRPDLMLLDLQRVGRGEPELRRRLAAERIEPLWVALSADEPAVPAGGAASTFADRLRLPLDVAALMRSLDRLLGPPAPGTPPGTAPGTAPGTPLGAPAGVTPLVSS